MIYINRLDNCAAFGGLIAAHGSSPLVLDAEQRVGTTPMETCPRDALTLLALSATRRLLGGAPAAKLAQAVASWG